MVKSGIVTSLVSLLMCSSNLMGSMELQPIEYHLCRDSNSEFTTLLIGLNYIGSRSELSNCINDVEHIKKFLLIPYMGLKESDMVTMTDHSWGSKYPSADNIRTQISSFVSNINRSKEGYFHYSGHGSHIKDYDHDEIDYQDEILCPLDIEQGRYITDDELFESLIMALDTDVVLTICTDCCHSGTIMDLPYRWRMDGTYDVVNKLSQYEKSEIADVVMISGCQDDQTSMDGGFAIGSTTGAGAMTAAFLTTLQNHEFDLTYRELLAGMEKYLKDYRLAQRPQLSSTRLINLDDKYMTVKVSLRGA